MIYYILWSVFLHIAYYCSATILAASNILLVPKHCLPHQHTSKSYCTVVLWYHYCSWAMMHCNCWLLCWLLLVVLCVVVCSMGGSYTSTAKADAWGTHVYFAQTKKVEGRNFSLVFVTKVDSLTVDIFNQTYDVWGWCTNAPLKPRGHVGAGLDHR